MTEVGKIATIIAGQPSSDAAQIVQDAWALWRSVTTEIQRRSPIETDGANYVYRQSLRGHVMRLWPTLDGEERTNFERELYSYLRQTMIAKCVQRSNPPVWHVAMSWRTPEQTAVVIPVRTYRAYVATHTERRLTPEEAGETMAPGPVTIRRKEVMTATDTAASLRPFHAERTQQMEERRALIAEFLTSEAPEPLVTEEVAHYMDVNVSTARNDLQALLEAGIIYAREETAEERAIRYGATAYARRSTLYWGKSDIPERTMREAVSGFVAARADRADPASSSEIDRKIWCKLKRKGKRSRFTAIDIAEATNLSPESVRTRFRRLEEAGLIEKVGMRNTEANRREYRILDSEGVREALNQPPVEVLPEDPTPPVVTVTKTAAAPPAGPTSAGDAASDLMKRAIEILDENERLRQRVRELEQQVSDLTQPEVDPDVARRLLEWTPST